MCVQGLEGRGREHLRLRRDRGRRREDDEGERAGEGEVGLAAGDEGHADHRTSSKRSNAARSLHGKR